MAYWSILRDCPWFGLDGADRGGQNIGRVDSVIGSVNSGLIHVVLSKRIDPASATGAPVEIFRSSNKKVNLGIGAGDSRNRISKVARKAGHRKNGTANRVLPTWVVQMQDLELQNREMYELQREAVGNQETKPEPWFR